MHGLAAQSDNPRFAWDSYRRLIQMFGKTVQHIEGERFEHALDELKARKGVAGDLDLDAGDLEELVAAYKAIVREHTGATSRRTRASSWRRRSTRCSRRGTPSGRCSTGARSGSRTSWARR